MSTDHKIDELLERIRPLMPSYGVWPFTLLKVKRKEYQSLSLVPDAIAEDQIIVLVRTDFDRQDLLDYLINSKEFNSMPAYMQEDFLNYRVSRLKDPEVLPNWSANIASMAMGIALQLSEEIGLCIEVLDTDLSALDDYFSFSNKNLKAIQFYDIYSCV